MPAEKTLEDILALRRSAGVPLPVSVAIAILGQTCDALLAIPGAAPIAFSPAQIVVSAAGQVRLIPGHTSLAYLAPEYLMSGATDRRAELFALGAIALEMLANRPLFAGEDDRDTAARVCTLPIQPPSSVNPYVPPELDHIVLTALARDPAYRWQHPAMMRDGLLAVAQRLGLVLAPGDAAPWIDLLADRVARPEPLPPSDPGLWNDDENAATRIDMAAPEPPPPAPPRALTAGSLLPEVGPEPTQIGAMPLISLQGTPLVALVGEGPQRSARSTNPPVGTYMAAPEASADRRRRLLRIGAIAAIAVIAVIVVVIIVVVLVVR